MRNGKPALDLDRFLPYRLSVLTNTVSRAFAKHYSERFDLSVHEWRVMAVLGRYPHLSANDIAQRTAMDKVQVSRAVRRLMRAKRVARETDGADGRVKRLALTPRGRAIYAEIVPMALGFEKALKRALSPSEARAFEKLAAKLSGAARALRENGKRRRP